MPAYALRADLEALERLLPPLELPFPLVLFHPQTFFWLVFF